jgi:hypothetical protein
MRGKMGIGVSHLRGTFALGLGKAWLEDFCN